MAVDQVQEIPGAYQLDPPEPYQIGRQQRRDAAESKRSQNTVTKGLTLLCLRQAEDEHGQDHRIVGAEKTFESDEKSDCEEVVRREHHSQYDAAGVLTPRLEH